jgi:hypothetical protein
VNHTARPPNGRPVGLGFCAGLVFGLLVSIFFVWRWVDTGAGTHISVLGSGKYVSVLVSHEQRRVLIASGSNGSAFATALSKALPPISETIDVLLVDTRASAEVIDRAQSLPVKTVLRLPDPDNTSDAGTVQRSFQMNLGDGVSISLRMTPARSWTAVIETPAGQIVIAPGDEPMARSAIRISLDGSLADSPISPHTSVDIGPAANGQSQSTNRAIVGAGGVLAISVDQSTFHFPRGTFAVDRSGEGTNQLTRLDGHTLIELGPHRGAQVLVPQHIETSQGHRLGNQDRIAVPHLRIGRVHNVHGVPRAHAVQNRIGGLH